MRIQFCAFLLVVVTSFASGQVCKSNQYDMLNWMAPQNNTVNGHYNVVFPQTGTFYWVKGKSGFPWDVDTFDTKFIYQSITEQDWNDPNTYKIFQTALPWMPRCIDIPSTPGKIASITVDATKSWFDIHTSCNSFTSHNLGYVVNEIWGPYMESFDGKPPAQTLTLSYRYSCDSRFSDCRHKETFAMQKGNGMVQWTYYELRNGEYVRVNQTTHGLSRLGSVAPVHPCW
ncbi:MAG TPA: hypothetical protein VJ731_06600 [Terriglobales bacterium]|nr:hypothetical protein [Terriglobales bacterium]